MNDLRSIREERRLTQQDLAGITGISQPHIQALEAGKYLPQLRTRKRIEQILGAEIDWLATTSGDKDHITRQLLEMLNIEAENVLERISHVRRILHEIEQSIKAIEQ